MMLVGPSNNAGYLFRREMGAGIGLSEPEPVNIIEALSSLARRAVQVARKACPGVPIEATVQYGNESDFYYNDGEILDVMMVQRRDPEPVYPFIHQASHHQPLKPGFTAKMAQLLDLCCQFGTKNICVHLPLDTGDTTQALLDELCADAFLEILASSRVSIDLENNWHGSWFGFPDNLLVFFDALDDRLQSSGRKDLKPRFAMTFDSGHLFAQCQAARLPVARQLEVMFDTLGNRVRTLHLHGNDGSGDQHVPFVDPARMHRSKRFMENQEALLAALPMLDLPARARDRRSPWNLVLISEIAVPFTIAGFLDHVRLVLEHL